MPSLLLLLTIALCTVSVNRGQSINATTQVILSNTTIVCPSISLDALQKNDAELKDLINQMWTSLTGRISDLESRLAYASSCSGSTGYSSSGSTLDGRIYRNLTIVSSWKLIYDRPYSDQTTTSILRNTSLLCPNQVLVGARRNSDPQLTLAAAGPKEVLQQQTAVNGTIRFGDVYWYLTASKSFGFSPNNRVFLNSGDMEESTPELRLSWHVDQNVGGYRIGTLKELNGDSAWRKVIYCLN